MIFLTQTNFQTWPFWNPWIYLCMNHLNVIFFFKSVTILNLIFLNWEQFWKAWLFLNIIIFLKNRNKFWILNNILECERFLKNLIMGKESYFFQVSKLFVFSTICPFFAKKGSHFKECSGLLKNGSCLEKSCLSKTARNPKNVNFFRKIVFKKLVFYFKNIWIPKLLKIFKKMFQTIVENVFKSRRCVVCLNIFALLFYHQ